MENGKWKVENESLFPDFPFSIFRFPFFSFIILAKKRKTAMKHCPNCKTNYTDDLSFCLDDGTPLVAVSDTQQPTVLFSDEEAQTVVRTPQTERMNINLQETQPAQNWQQQSQFTQLKPQLQPQPTPKKSNTAMVVLLTAFVMLLLFGAGLGAWLIVSNRSKVPPGNRDFPTPTKTPSNSNTTNTNKSPTPSPSASPTASVEPSIMQTPPEIDTAQIKSEVLSRMNAWKSSMESGSLDSVISNYADRLDYYYRAGSVSSSYVRNNKKRAFELYYSFSVGMTGMQITPDASGQKATIVFNKSWVFTGSGDDSKGTVRAQFQATKIAGNWYITGEKDL
jgi:hypothetical protein